MSSRTSRAHGMGMETKGKRANFVRLLEAICALREVDSKALLQSGRQWQWVAARAKLVYLAREWRLTTKELGRRLHRDASMISRLCGWYRGHQHTRAEEKLAREMAERVVLLSTKEKPISIPGPSGLSFARDD